eukprot:1189854-Prorocentrum_minimum.AAC.6
MGDAGVMFLSPHVSRGDAIDNAGVPPRAAPDGADDSGASRRPITGGEGAYTPRRRPIKGGKGEYTPRAAPPARPRHRPRGAGLRLCQWRANMCAAAPSGGGADIYIYVRVEPYLWVSDPALGGLSPWGPRGQPNTGDERAYSRSGSQWVTSRWAA